MTATTKFVVTAVTTKLVVTGVMTKLVSTADTTKLVVVAITISWSYRHTFKNLATGKSCLAYQSFSSAKLSAPATGD